MILFNYYADNVDYTWYQSSNVVYSKCIDNPNQLKTLIVVFNNGGTYQYDDIPVQDYLMFRNASSQGKSLNEIIKKGGYKYSKLENTNLEELNEEYIKKSNNGYTLVCDDTGMKLLNNVDALVYSTKKQFDKDTLDIIRDMFKSIGVIIEINNKSNVQ